MKKLYSIDYWVPFPRSEYGGLVVVIAKDEDECYDLLVDFDDNEDYCGPKLREAINKARVFNLVDDLESTVVDHFIT